MYKVSLILVHKVSDSIGTVKVRFNHMAVEYLIVIVKQLGHTMYTIYSNQY